MLRALCLCLYLSGFLPAQITLEPDYPTVLTAGGDVLDLAWLGGLNAPQWNAADLDGDGTQDLLLFDRAGDALVALRGRADGTYSIAPALAAGFPRGLVSWVLLRDYDGDGAEDLFTYAASSDGLSIYRGQRSDDGLLTFPATPTYAGLRYPLGSGTAPVFITSIDYPAFDDLDGDGDLDLLTFSVGGGFVEYYQNQSVEQGFGRDTLIYTLVSDCWGGFFESGLTPALDLADSPGGCFTSATGSPPVEPRHAGSTVLTLDLDGNGLRDIMLGDVSFEFLVAGFNTGTAGEAFVSRQDAAWQSAGTTVDIDFFPAAYHLDVDGDGARDLVASPNQTLNAEDLDVGWYYRNFGSDGAPDFRFQQRRLLVGQSIDLGTGAIPTVFDADADGRPDLVIGNTEAYSEDLAIRSRLHLYRNVSGPGGMPTFQLVDDDYLALAQFQSTTSAFAPAFGDLDGDGDEDAIVGERAGKLIYFENTAGRGQPATFAAPVFDYQEIDAGQLAKPVIIDLDRDGLSDLVVGGFDGRIRFFRNVGTAGEPTFAAATDAPGNQLQLGGINTNVPGISTGHPTPLVLDYDDRFVLLTGNRAGTLEAYAFTDPTEEFTLLSDTLAGLDVGGFSNPAAGDFDGDGFLELVVGNQRGGVQYYRSNLTAEPTTSLFTRLTADLPFSVSPNPTRGQLWIRGLAGTQVQHISLYSPLGQFLESFSARGGDHYPLDLSVYPPGMYTVVVSSGGRVGSARVVRQ